MTDEPEELPGEGDEELAQAGQVVVFDPDAFERFCARLRIDSKEMGRIPLKLLGTQRYLIQQLAKGLARGVHTFVVLKGRQIGISTVTLALDLYWLFKHPGLQGAVVTDTDDNRDLFRSNIALLLSSLPPQARKQIVKHNRVQMLFKNGSRLMYMVAGTKKNGELGRAKSANFMHGTETSSWGDEEGIGSLVNTLAQKNPNRLYILESTARGYNAFFEIWDVAKKSRTQGAIFIGWWLNELYAWDPETIEYRTYWDGALTSDEAVWVRDVYQQYQHEITPEQIAWWRWYVHDQMKGDEMLALQEMPPTEEYAFQLSGSKFFASDRVNQAYTAARQKPAIYFRYIFGQNFEDSQFIETEPENAEVTIWELPAQIGEKPNQSKDGVYCNGADPAYGSSEWADLHACCIMRAYADRLVQVAEAGSADWTDIQFAWVLAHLSGWYGNTMLNLEMQGPGGAVYNEIGNLKKRAGLFPKNDPRAGPFDVVGRVRDYLYHRQDTMHGSYAYQWQTTLREKVRLMSTFRSHWERGVIEVNSPECLQQFRNIRRTGDKIGGEGRAKDDRVMAAAIATIAWNDWLMLELQSQGRTYLKEHQPHATPHTFSPLEKSVLGYLKDQKIEFRGLTK